MEKESKASFHTKEKVIQALNVFLMDKSIINHNKKGIVTHSGYNIACNFYSMMFLKNDVLDLQIDNPSSLDFSRFFINH